MTGSPTRRRGRLLAVMALLALFGAMLPRTASADPLPAGATHLGSRALDPIAHDPTIVREGGWYYVAITGDAGKPNTFLPMKRSRDLIHWQELGPVFTSLPSWIVPALGVSPSAAPKDLWAPDLSYSHGEWRLYYAASLFGRNTSVIGLATTRSLDPNSPAFGWHDEGLVLKSTDYRQPGGSSFNAIDPNVTVDAGGHTWLSFGSFFSGIWLHRLDGATGKIPSGDPAVHISERAAPDAEENSSIVYHDGYYYLFLSFDYCCRSVESDYRTVVARSRAITGPYVDAAGVPMLNDKGGTEVMRGYNEFVGAGGADVLLGTDGRPDLMVNHYYDATDQGTPKLNVRTLTWSADGWPRVSYPLNPSVSIGHGDAYLTISPRGASTVVENAGCGYEGANIALWTDLGNLCQQWQVSNRGVGARILNRFSNDVAEDAGCNNTDGANVAQWGWIGFLGSNPCQRWSFAPASDGYTTISTIQTGGRSWTAEGDPGVPGTNIAIDAPTGARNQQFRFDPLGGVLLGSPTEGDKTLGVTGCVSRHPDGARVAFQRRLTQGCQVWTFTPADGTASARYLVTNARSGAQLAAGPHGLEAVRRADSPASRRTWTLQPANDGTWTLRSGGSTLAMKLLLP